MRVRTIGLALALAGIIGTGTAQAAHVPNQYIDHHLRVGGATDFKGRVFAQQGLRVRHGLNIDTLTALGSAQIGGSMAVAGTLTSNGLNGGAGAISTTGALQAGSLTLSGAATVTGGLTVNGTSTLQGANIGAGGLQVSGPLNATGGLQVTGTINASNGLQVNGALSAGSGSFNGAIAAPTATFTHLAIASGGTVDFGGATLTNVNLSSTATSLTLQSASEGGTNGFHPLTITQAGKTATLSVSSAGYLTVNGVGLAAATAGISGNLSAGSLTTSTITSPNAITLDAPTVMTTGNFKVGGSGHLLGTHDMRGTCTAGASTSIVNSCQVGFSQAYGAPPIVVVTPTNVDPAVVTGWSVQSSTGGFTISFRVSSAGTYTFNYIVEG